MKISTKVATVAVSLICALSTVMPAAHAGSVRVAWRSCGSKYVTARAKGYGYIQVWAADRYKHAAAGSKPKLVTVYSGEHNGRVKASVSSLMDYWKHWCRRANYH